MQHEFHNPDHFGRNLPADEVLAYGAGHLALQCLLLTAQLFLLYYYTEYAGVSCAVVALAILPAALVCLIVRPFIPALLRPSAYGQSRIWCQRLLLPVLITLIVLFTLPHRRRIYIDLAIIFCTYVALIGLVHPALEDTLHMLGRSMSSDLGTIGLLQRFRRAGTALGTIVITTVTSLAVLLLGDDIDAWLKGFTAISLIPALALFLCAWRTRERRGGRDSIAIYRNPEEMLIAIFKNRPFWIIVAATLLFSTADAMFCSGHLFFLKYWGQEPLLIIPMMIVLALATCGSAQLLIDFRDRLRPRRRCLMLAALLAMLAFVLRIIDPTWMLLSYAACLLLGLSQGLILSLLFLMIRDAALWGEAKTGTNATDLMYLILSTVLQFSLPLGLGLTAFTLFSGGFEPGIVPEGGTLRAILVAVGILPAAGYALGIIALSFYDLDPKLDDLRKRIGADHARRAILEH